MGYMGMISLKGDDLRLIHVHHAYTAVHRPCQTNVIRLYTCAPDFTGGVFLQLWSISISASC